MSVNPVSPANNNSPYLIGIADEKTSVEVYIGSACNGFLVAMGTAEQFASPGIPVSVSDDSSTAFSVVGVSGGSRSPCSNSLTYVEDSTPPVAPSPISITPAGPANDNSPQVSGLAENGSTVNIFATSNCSGSIVATGNVAAFTTGIAVSVLDDATTSFTAKAVDLAGNISACSASVGYTEDSTPPMVTSVTSSTANGSYGPGSNISIQVNFSETVMVTGTPQLILETGASDAVVNYASGSGSSTLTFTYTVGAGQNSADLDYVATASLALNGGTIKDAATNNATFALPSPGAAGSLAANKAIAIDAVAPTVTNVTSSAADGIYTIGAIIPVQVTFSKVVNVTGTPQLTLETGASDAVINYTGGTGTNTLIFSYTVASGHASADLDYVATTSLALNSGTIKDTVTTNPNSATLTLVSPGAAGSLSANKAIVIDTAVPTVTNVTSSASNGTYGSGSAISIQVTFSKAVTVTGTPQLTLETGANDAVVNYSGVGSGTNTLTFNYTAAYGENSADLDYVSTSALALNSGTIKDAATNNATLTLPSPGAAGSLGFNKAIVVDAVAPTVTNVTSSAANGSYTVGAVIPIVLTFSKVVGVTGTPLLTLETGATDAVVNYSSGTGTNTLTFNYTVASGHTSPDLDYVAEPPLELNGGTIKDTVPNNPNDAALVFVIPGSAGSLGSNKAIVIDTAAPTVTNVTSSTVDGTYGIGAAISIQVSFSEAVTVTGTPQLTLETGATDAVVNYASGSGSSTLTFTYTVGAGHSSPDLDYVATTSLALNGGTIKDAATNNATLTLPSPGAAGSLAANKAIVIDAVAPTVTVNQAAAQSDPTNLLPIVFDVVFSEAINASTFTASDITQNGTATGITWSLSTADNINYTLQATAVTTNGTVVPSIAANAVQDPATNGNTASTSSDNSVTYDTVAPSAPNGLSMSPTSPANDNSPEIQGTAEAGSTVSVYATNDCSGSVVASGSAAIFASTGITLSVLDNTTTSFTAKAADAAGNASACSSSVAYTEDSTAPTVTSVSSNKANGSYGESTVIDIRVTFSEAVIVTGTPQITLETGATDRTVSYASGSGTAELLFNYTVQAGDTASDLDYAVTTALALNGGTIKDAAGNNATLTLAAPGAAGSLGANKAIVIDTTAPTAPSSVDDGVVLSSLTASPAISWTASTDAGGSGIDHYEAAIGTSAGASDIKTWATLTSGSAMTGLSLATNTTYYASVRAIDVAGNVSSVGQGNGWLADTTAPAVTAWAAVTSPTVLASNIPVTLTFSEPVSGLATTDFSITNGTVASVSASSGTSFTVYVNPSSTTSQTDVTVSLDASTVADAAGNNNASGSGNTVIGFYPKPSSLGGTSPSNDPTPDVTVGNGASGLSATVYSDSSCTTSKGGPAAMSGATVAVTSDTISSSTTYYAKFSDAGGNFSACSTASFAYTFDTTAPNAATSLGWVQSSPYNSTSVTASWTKSDSTDLANQKIQFYSDGACTATSGSLIDLGSASTQTQSFTGANGTAYAYKVTSIDTAGNSAVSACSSSMSIDTTAPTVSSVTTTTATGTYGVPTVVNVTVNFSEAVNVVGTPAITLNTTPSRSATYVSGTGSASLVFGYTIVAGDSDARVDYVSTGALSAGTSIQDAATNDAVLTLPALTTSGLYAANIVVDTSPALEFYPNNDPYDYGVQSVNTDHTFTIRNTGGGSNSSTITSSLVGGSSSKFNIVTDNCGAVALPDGLPQYVSPGVGECTIVVRFLAGTQLSGGSTTLQSVATSPSVTLTNAISGTVTCPGTKDIYATATTGTTYTVPGGCNTLAAKLWGGGGGGGPTATTTQGGGGGYIEGTLAVNPGDTLTVLVGGAGTSSSPGINGGGVGHVADGAGYSAVKAGAVIQLLAGGGGGGSAKSAGGPGGGFTGVDGAANSGTQGLGGTATAGGAGGAAGPGGSAGSAGSSLQGGTYGALWSGGGGGGYFGGGGGGGSSLASGPNGGGGGGSSYSAAGVTNVTTTAGTGKTPGSSADADRGTSGNGAAGGGSTAGVAGKVVITPSAI